ncbi:MAG: alginate export family protein [Candidatus Omnitrophica bacterium]|nr:alginate export family protein [Candidatus Omnitrophota bacterium]MDD5610532.1 alginate export family protein [Candidatus Omnitrophota bacterium]
MLRFTGYLLFLFILVAEPCFAQFNLMDNEAFSLALSGYLQTDVISVDNVVDLDSHNKEDRFTYFGIDYSLGFHVTLKKPDHKFYLKLERNGPYDYDAPLFIHNKLTVAGPREIRAYRNEELLPQAEEFWYDLPIKLSTVRLKAGLFGYEIGKGYAMGTGTYENYGAMLYQTGENFVWRLSYLRPDLVYKTRLGPRIKQEVDEGIGYQPNAANFFAIDATFNVGKNSLQPFLTVLSDYTHEDKRSNLFSTTTDRDILGMFGLSADFIFDKLSLGLELAHNFGQAKSNNADFKDIEHKGYLMYADASYDLGKFSPHMQFLFSSGNKVTTEMVDNGDTFFPGGSNNAFSIYSPFNTNFFDSLSPSTDSLPLVFFGWGYGLSYGLGLYRPSTFADDGIYENMLMPSLGFNYQFTEKLSATFDWWYLRANERGVGKLNNVARELSRDLGNEVDLRLSYDISEHLNISLYTGYFWPGKYFREERDDTDGSLFTPFVRGDGEADDAYQIELVAAFEF